MCPVHSVFFFLQERLILELRLNVLIFFLRFEAENIFKMFLNYMVYTTCISINQCGRDQETYQSALPAEIWYQELLIMTNRDVCHHTKHALKYFSLILVNLRLLP